MVVIQLCFHYHSVKLKVQFTHNHNLHVKLIQLHVYTPINIIIKLLCKNCILQMKAHTITYTKLYLVIYNLVVPVSFLLFKTVTLCN